jgi:hypothetical protein
MKIEMSRILVGIICFLSLSAGAQKPKATDVHLEIQPDPTGKALVNWSITNNSKLAVYVYDFFLWGPAKWDDVKGDVTILGTAPTQEEAICPPNRVAPFLLLVVFPGRTIHGDFIDDRLKLAPKAKVAMRIAIFSDPYRVVEESKRFYESRCEHSPYDAIVREGTSVESNVVQLPETAQSGASANAPGDTLSHESGHADPPKPQ